VLRTTFRHKKDEQEAGGNMHNKELHELYSSTIITEMIKSIRWE
jgi:hypothetical protein